MPEIRTLRIRALWANGAPTPPADPVWGMIYKWDYMDPSQDPVKQYEGQPFFTRGDSARWNGIIYTLSALVQLCDLWGIMPWAVDMVYQTNALVLSPNGTVYRCKANHTSGSANSPDTILGQNNFWINFVHSEQLQSDWNITDTSHPGYIRNKPAFQPPAPGGGPWAGQSGGWTGIPCQCVSYPYCNCRAWVPCTCYTNTCGCNSACTCNTEGCTCQGITCSTDPPPCPPDPASPVCPPDPAPPCPPDPAPPCPPDPTAPSEPTLYGFFGTSPISYAYDLPFGEFGCHYDWYVGASYTTTVGSPWDVPAPQASGYVWALDFSVTMTRQVAPDGVNVSYFGQISGTSYVPYQGGVMVCVTAGAAVSATYPGMPMLWFYIDHLCHHAGVCERDPAG